MLVKGPKGDKISDDCAPLVALRQASGRARLLKTAALTGRPFSFVRNALRFAARAARCVNFFLSPDEIEALLLCLKVSAVAVSAALPFAFAAALLLARARFPGKTLLDGMVHLPLVLPPVAVGFLLLMLFGTRGGAGRLAAGRISASASSSAGPAPRWPRAIITFPFQVRAIRLALEARDHGLERGRRNAGRRAGSTGSSISPCRWRCRASSPARSPPSPPASASSAPSSPSSPTFPAKPAPCRSRSTAPCRRRAARPKRRACRCCRLCWR